MRKIEANPGATAISPSSKTELLDWCSRLGWRVTEARLAILQASFATEGYFDAEQLVASAKALNESASRATVYRALPQLCEAGLLRKTDVGDGRTHYSRTSPDEIPSAEIYVEDCGLILKVPAPFLTWYAASITERVGLKLTSQRLQTFARCSHKKADRECEQCVLPTEAKKLVP